MWMSNSNLLSLDLCSFVGTFILKLCIRTQMHYSTLLWKWIQHYNWWHFKQAQLLLSEEAKLFNKSCNGVSSPLFTSLPMQNTHTQYIPTILWKAHRGLIKTSVICGSCEPEEPRASEREWKVWEGNQKRLFKRPIGQRQVLQPAELWISRWYPVTGGGSEHFLSGQSGAWIPVHYSWPKCSC